MRGADVLSEKEAHGGQFVTLGSLCVPQPGGCTKGLEYHKLVCAHTSTVQG